VISGTVTGRLALVQLMVRGPEGAEASVEFRLDTGFSGSLTLPPDACVVLKLPFLYRQPARVAGGSQAILDVYEAKLLWDGAERTIEVLAISGPPLIGMGTLAGNTVRIDVTEGGTISVESLA
jgi:clan AA aspartic protease